MTTADSLAPVPPLSFLRIRLTLRLLEPAPLPATKGAMLRGGFGYAFQRVSCPSSCWNHTDACPLPVICPYRQVFETPRPPGVAHLHDLRDIPRPFVIDSPTDLRTQYAAGESLEFGLLLIGHGIDALSYFLLSFEQLGSMGLGRAHAHFRLERVEALQLGAATGVVIYQDGRSLQHEQALPLIDAAAIVSYATALPPDMRLLLRTPLRLKVGGTFAQAIDLPALVRAIGWRLRALALFHGTQPWNVEHTAYIQQAQALTVEQQQVRWHQVSRTSTRGPTPEERSLGGLVGSAVLRGVPVHIRTLLLYGSLVHVGKACTFGDGKLELAPIS